METWTCSLRSVFRNGSCSICPLLLIGCSAVVFERAPVAPCQGAPKVPRTAPLSSAVAACGCGGIRISTGIELYPEGGAAQFERFGKEMFQIALVPGRYMRQSGAVDHDQRRILATLVRIAELG